MKRYIDYNEDTKTPESELTYSNAQWQRLTNIIFDNEKYAMVENMRGLKEYYFDLKQRDQDIRQNAVF